MMIAAAIAMAGCPAGDDSSDSGQATDGNDDGATGMMTTPQTMTMTSSPGDDTVGVDDGDDGDGGTADPTFGDDDGPACTPMPDGAMCSDDCGCDSGNCFNIPIFGGLCGECKTDADCPDGGCSVPNPLNGTGSTCNMGEPGGGCETSDVCMRGLTCGTLLDVPGILTLSTCGECLEDADCTEGEATLCSPTIDVQAFSGQKICVIPGSVPNGQACDHLGTGNDACESGLCAVVDIMTVVQVGVCGDCEVDADCEGEGEVCNPADFDLDSLEVIPPTCAVPR